MTLRCVVKCLASLRLLHSGDLRWSGDCDANSLQLSSHCTLPSQSLPATTPITVRHYFTQHMRAFQNTFQAARAQGCAGPVVVVCLAFPVF